MPEARGVCGVRKAAAPPTPKPTRAREAPVRYRAPNGDVHDSETAPRPFSLL